MPTVSTQDLGQFEMISDIGIVNPGGKCTYDSELQTYTLSGAGKNIWGHHDDFSFAWRRFKGDFIVTMQASFLGKGKNLHRKLGWMARTSLDPDSPHVSTGIHGGDGLLSLQYRRETGAITEEVRAPLVGADVVQLERRGKTYIMSVAQFGQPFVSVEVENLNLGHEVFLGIFVCSHEDGISETARFHNVRIVSPVKEGFDRQKDPFGSHLEILELETGKRTIIHSDKKVFEAPNWMKDNEALIYNSEGKLYRFDLTSKASTLIPTGEVVHNNNDHVLSFDGKMLAISSHDESHTSQIYTVPVEGGIPKRITPIGPSYLHGWSPDGKYLVYTARRNGDFDIFRVPSTGGEEVQLTTAIGLDDGPEYTPDGKFIYFNSVRSGSMEIWRMSADGSAQEQLTNDEYNNWFPHISPDGKEVIFVSYLAGETEPSDHPAAKRVYLRTMPLDGGETKVVAYLYGGQGTMNVPSWSPDSKYVAFVSNTVPFD